jgi:hypothetical protein
MVIWWSSLDGGLTKVPEDANVAIISSEYFNNISMSKVTSEFHALELEAGNQSELIVVSQSPPPETALGKPQAVKTSSEPSGEVSLNVTEIPDVNICGRPLASRNW